MAYAGRPMMEKLWGAKFIADILADDADPETSIADALEQASGEMDIYISARYDCPLPSAPRPLQMLCANIAVYILANRHTVLTSTIEDRYKHSLKVLERIADGRAGLGADTPKIAAGDGASSSGAAFFADPRRMGRFLP